MSNVFYSFKLSYDNGRGRDARIKEMMENCSLSSILNMLQYVGSVPSVDDFTNNIREQMKAFEKANSNIKTKSGKSSSEVYVQELNNTNNSTFPEVAEFRDFFDARDAYFDPDSSLFGGVSPSQIWNQVELQVNELNMPDSKSKELLLKILQSGGVLSLYDYNMLAENEKQAYADYTGEKLPPENPDVSYIGYDKLRYNILNSDKIKFDEDSNKDRDFKNRLSDLLVNFKDVYQKRLDFFDKAKKITDIKDQMNNIANLPNISIVKLLEFYEQCKILDKMDEFDKAYADMFFECKDEDDNTIRSYKPNIKGNNIENDHKFWFDDKGRLRHAIYNLSNTGLDVCIIPNIVDGKKCTQLGFLNIKDSLNREQLKALAEYCYYNQINIEDYGDLANIKCELNENKTVSADKVLREEMNKLAKISEEDIYGKEESNDRIFDNFVKREDKKSVNSGQGHWERVKAVKTALALGGKRDNVTKITSTGNSTIISVYSDANDLNDDLEVDKKGHIKRLKEFSIEVYDGNPQVVSFYRGPKSKKVEDSMVRPAIEALRTAGNVYFTLGPNMDKDIRKAALVAAAKSGIVPLLKSSPNSKGCDKISIGEIKEYLKTVNEDDQTPKKRVLTYMRLANQLEKLVSWDSKSAQELGTYLVQTKTAALFKNFDCDAINNYIDKKIASENWNGLDQTAATAAKIDLLLDIKKGKIGNKPYDPLNVSEKELIEALEMHITKNKDIVEKRYKRERRLGGDENGKDTVATNAIRKYYDSLLNATISEINEEGGDLVKLDNKKLATKYSGRSIGGVDEEDVKGKKGGNNPVITDPRKQVNKGIGGRGRGR